MENYGYDKFAEPESEDDPNQSPSTPSNSASANPDNDDQSPPAGKLTTAAAAGCKVNKKVHFDVPAIPRVGSGIEPLVLEMSELYYKPHMDCPQPEVKVSIGSENVEEELERAEPIPTSSNRRTVTKMTVYVQVVFMKIGEIDTMKETFSADMFVQARWREPELDGKLNAKEMNHQAVNLDKYWNPKLYVDNTAGISKEPVTSHTVMYDSESWEAYIVERRRLQATFLENLELFTYPFDTQDITVTLVSERTDDELTLQDDPKQLSTINVESFVDEQEWRLYNEVVTFRGSVHKFYEGDSAECLGHPSISCRTHARRRPGFYIINIFVVMVFELSMSLTSFSTDIERSHPIRIQLIILLVLTTVSFTMSANAQVPRVSYLTTLDKYTLISISTLVLTAIWHSLLPTLISRYGVDSAKHCDNSATIFFGVLLAVEHLAFGTFVILPAVRRDKACKEQEREHVNLEKNKNHFNGRRGKLLDVGRPSISIV